MTGLIVTKLRRDTAGIWRARVSLNGSTLDVDRRFGSWQADVRIAGSRRFERREVMPAVAAALQERALRLERRETRHD